MSVLSVQTIGGVVPMKGVGLESKIFDMSFDGFAAVSGPASRVLAGTRSSTPPPFSLGEVAGSGPAMRVEKPNKPLPAIPPSDPTPREQLAPAADHSRATGFKNPDEVKYTSVHKVVYTDLKSRGVSLPGLRLLLSSSDGMRKLSGAFTDEGAMAISTSNPVKMDWDLGVALVPYHMAGCLCMVSSIAGKPAPGKLPAFIDLYKRYDVLVKETLVFCVDTRSKDEHAKDFGNIILRHAVSTADYLSFFVRNWDVLRLRVDEVDTMNITWVNKLLNPMRKHIALIRARFLAEHNARLEVRAWNQADEEERDAAKALTFDDPEFD